jgi:hypothetical protein
VRWKDKYSGSDRDREVESIKDKPSGPDIDVHILSNGYSYGLNADGRMSRKLGILDIGTRWRFLSSGKRRHLVSRKLGQY